MRMEAIGAQPRDKCVWMWKFKGTIWEVVFKFANWVLDFGYV